MVLFNESLQRAPRMSRKIKPTPKQFFTFKVSIHLSSFLVPPVVINRLREERFPLAKCITRFLLKFSFFSKHSHRTVQPPQKTLPLWDKAVSSLVLAIFISQIEIVA